MTTDKPSLRECPFCGHKNNGVSDNGRGLMFNVHCGNGACRAAGPWERCAADAIAAWNTRTTEPQQGLVERVALAIANTFTHGEKILVASQEHWQNAAKSAIAAMTPPQDNAND